MKVWKPCLAVIAQTGVPPWITSTAPEWIPEGATQECSLTAPASMSAEIHTDDATQDEPRHHSRIEGWFHHDQHR